MATGIGQRIEMNDLDRLNPESRFTEFLTGVAKLTVTASLMRDVVQDAMRQARRLDANLDQETLALTGGYSAGYSFGFFRADSGKRVSAGMIEHTADDKVRELALAGNFAQSWLLATAYELYESLLFDLHAKAERCEICLPIAGNTARSRKPEKMLEAFRSAFPTMLIQEERYRNGVDLSLVPATAAALRHRIVHRQGTTEDRLKVAKDVVQRCQQSGVSRTERVVLEFIAPYFGTNDHQHTVVMSSRPIQFERMPTYYLPLDDLLQLLAAQGHLIATWLERKITD
jgi:hypothetical protein